ncbi:hypothetical protein VTK56DRAFT_8677 [Thermocarpiscus australiensis]
MHRSHDAASAKTEPLYGGPEQQPVAEVAVPGYENPSATDPTGPETLNQAPAECSSSVSSAAGLSSCSTSSDRHAGHGYQQIPEDRVFPIRSVIASHMGRASSEDGRSCRRVIMPESFRAASETRSMTGMKAGPVAARFPTSLPAATAQPARTSARAGSRSSVHADAERHGIVRPISIPLGESSDGEPEPGEETRSPANGGTSGRDASPDPQPEAHYAYRFKHVLTNEGHAVITGRDGTLQRCEDEPIHTPGAIQAFGSIVVIQEDPDGRFRVRYVSENSKRIIGYSPQELFRLQNFLDILTEE